MITPDDVNTLIAEDRQYRIWERETKNKILSIYNPTRKQEEWKKHFGVKQEPDDSYLTGNVF
jgi:hypothetical protein